MSNIVVLDYCNLGTDLNYDSLKEIGNVEFHAYTYQNEIKQRIQHANFIITSDVLPQYTDLQSANSLKLVQIAGTGYNHVNISNYKQLNIALANVADYSTNSVAQHTFSLLFSLIIQLQKYNDYVFSEEYFKGPSYTCLNWPFFELSEKKWGIIGLGKIGLRVAKIASSFGCIVSHYSGNNNIQSSNEYPALSLENLLCDSDIISIHVPLTNSSRNMIDYEQLCLMKKSAILLNIARGGIINEFALAQALNNGIIAAAGLDVFTQEPLEPDNPLLKLNNRNKLIMTPHIAWAAMESRQRLIDEMSKNIQSYLKGENRNRIV